MNAVQIVLLVVAALILVFWIFASLDSDMGPTLHALMYVPTIGLAVLLIIIIPVINREQEAWEHSCSDRGGHVVEEKETTVVTPTTGGGVGVGADTTYFCLTSDGRVLDIR